VICLAIFFNFIQLCLFIGFLGETTIVFTICNEQPDYPLLQMLRDLNFIAIYFVSIIFPISKKRIYHMLLPTGRHHDLVKTMRDFLMEP